MRRSVRRHMITPRPYKEALLEAFEWVCESNGTIILDLPSRRCDFEEVVACKYGKSALKRKEIEGVLNIGIAWGEHYCLKGSRIAMFDCADIDMKRIESALENYYSMCEFEELRSFTKEIDTHPKWTEKFNPEEIG